MTTPRQINLLANLREIMVHLNEVDTNINVVNAAVSQINDLGESIDWNKEINTTYTVADDNLTDAMNDPLNPTWYRVMLGSKATLDRAVSKKIATYLDDTDADFPDSYNFNMQFYSNHRVQAPILIGNLSISNFTNADTFAALADDNAKLNALYTLQDQVKDLKDAIDGYIAAC